MEFVYRGTPISVDLKSLNFGKPDIRLSSPPRGGGAESNTG